MHMTITDRARTTAGRRPPAGHPVPVPPRGAHPANEASRSGYTLIELLAVMVIMGIIILIALAGYNSISRGAACRKAAENVEVALSLARQHAVSRNVPVLFLLLDANFNGRNSGADPSGIDISKIGPTRGRHYAIFDASNRVYLTGWTELPKGVVFDASYGSDAVRGRNVLVAPDDMFYNRAPPPGTSVAMIPFPGSSDTTRMVTLPGIAFKTDGTIRLRSTPGAPATITPLRVNLAEGTATSAGVVTIRPGGIKYGVKVSILGSAVAEENASP